MSLHADSMYTHTHTQSRPHFKVLCEGQSAQSLTHTPSIAYQHLPPKSAKIGSVTEGAVYLCAAVQ